MVVSGIALISTPLWEKILDALLQKQFDVRISGPNDAAWGFALCALALVYHLVNTGIYDALRSRSKQERTSLEIEHDRSIFLKADSELTEQQLDWFLEVLSNDHSYRSSGVSRLDNFCRVLVATQNTFLRKTLDGRSNDFLVEANNLLEFISYKFFVFPSKQSGEDLRFCMVPGLNCDREGDGSPEQMAKYDALTDEVCELIKQVRKLYVELRISIKRELIV